MKYNILCENQIKEDKEDNFICKIGLYGGRPFAVNCMYCILNNQNNIDYAKEILSRSIKTHPNTEERVSGCCDSALNYH